MQAPSNLTVTSFTETGVSLQWQINGTGHVGVRIVRTTDPTWKYFEQIHWSSNPDLTQFTDNFVSPEQSLRYKITVFNFSEGTAPYSNEVAVIIPGVAAPIAPFDLYAVPFSDTVIDLFWNDASNDETGFKIERREGVLGAWSEIATVGQNVTTYRDSGLTPDTTYFYRIFSFKNSNNSTPVETSVMI